MANNNNILESINCEYILGLLLIWQKLKKLQGVN